MSLGFLALTTQELVVLKAFSNTGTVVWLDTSLDPSEQAKAIRSLKDRGIIHSNRPLKLTRRGKKLLKILPITEK